METPSDVTWEDVLAVAKMSGVVVKQVDKRYKLCSEQLYAVYNRSHYPTYYAVPKHAMDEVVLISKQPEMTWTVTAEL